MKSTKSGIKLSGETQRDFIEYEGRTFALHRFSDDFDKAKGGNSCIFKLIDPQEEYKDRIVKFSKFWKPQRPDEGAEEYKLKEFEYFNRRYSRFLTEIEALKIARENGFHNVVNIHFNGEKNIDGKDYPYYVMDKADTDLKEYILM